MNILIHLCFLSAYNKRYFLLLFYVYKCRSYVTHEIKAYIITVPLPFNHCIDHSKCEVIIIILGLCLHSKIEVIIYSRCMYHLAIKLSRFTIMKVNDDQPYSSLIRQVMTSHYISAHTAQPQLLRLNKLCIYDHYGSIHYTMYDLCGPI